MMLQETSCPSERVKRAKAGAREGFRRLLSAMSPIPWYSSTAGGDSILTAIGGGGLLPASNTENFPKSYTAAYPKLSASRKGEAFARLSGSLREVGQNHSQICIKVSGFAPTTRPSSRAFAAQLLVFLSPSPNSFSLFLSHFRCY